ncbi:TRAPP subunit [Coemansia sp. RSA 922]|nr:TRAPP subunit [Coemansia sp. RSA 922]
MDNTSLITFVEHAYWLVDQGPESSGITFEEAQHVLLKLDRIAHDLYGMTKMVTDLRPCLTDLVALMANIPTFRTAANAPAPPPAVASALIAAPVTTSPTIAHDPETPIKSLVASCPTELGVQRDESKYLNQFIVHAALDLVDDAQFMSTACYLKTIDRYNDWNVSAYVTPSNTRLMLLHEAKADDAIRLFFTDCHELYLKTLLNPFYEPNTPIQSQAFDVKVNTLAKKYLF